MGVSLKTETPIIVVGAGGLAKELVGYIEADAPNYKVAFLLADRDAAEPSSLLGYSVYSPKDCPAEVNTAVLAVGYPTDRYNFQQKLSGVDLNFISFVHPTAVVSPHAKLGTGCVIGPFVTIAGNAEIGDFCFLNALSAVGHDSKIGDYCSLMPYAFVGGGAELESQCLLAAGAKVLPSVKVGSRSRVSAGSVVTYDMPSESLVYGNPATAKPDFAMLKNRNS